MNDPLTRQKAVVAMGRRAIAPPDLSILMQDAAALLGEMLDTEYSGMAEPTADGKWLRLRLSQTAPEGTESHTLVHESSTSGSDSLAGYVLQVAHPVAVSDLAQEKRFTDRFLRAHNIRSALAAPLAFQDRSFGCLAAYSRRVRRFNDDDMLFVETIAHLVATAIARSRAEDALAQERRLSAGVLQTVDALVLTLDPECHVVRMNPACERVTGYALSETGSRPAWNVFAVPEEMEQFRETLEGVYRPGTTVEYESQLLTKHAQRRNIAWSCRGMFDRAGKLEWIIATGLDITQQREAQEKARRAELIAEQARTGSAAAPPQAGTFSPMPVPTGGERRRRPRRAYPYTQEVAFFLDGKLPSRAEFIAVRCNDIAAGGFSFFAPAPPPSDSLVVALGTPPKIAYLTAQVAHVTRTEHRGERMFLIGCNYTGRAVY
jgi:PAS domain S-box-containing protein